MGILALPFRRLYSQYKSIIRPPFLERFPLELFKNASHTSFLEIIVSSHKSSGTILYPEGL